MSRPNAKITYVPPNNPGIAETQILFDTTVACNAKRLLTGAGIHKFVVSIQHDEGGTLRMEQSQDRGANWIIVADLVVVTVATQITTAGDSLVEHFDDFRVSWINGGTVQAVWSVNMALSHDRATAGDALDFWGS